MPSTLSAFGANSPLAELPTGVKASTNSTAVSAAVHFAFMMHLLIRRRRRTPHWRPLRRHLPTLRQPVLSVIGSSRQGDPRPPRWRRGGFGRDLWLIEEAC